MRCHSSWAGTNKRLQFWNRFMPLIPIACLEPLQQPLGQLGFMYHWCYNITSTLLTNVAMLFPRFRWGVLWWNTLLTNVAMLFPRFRWGVLWWNWAGWGMSIATRWAVVMFHLSVAVSALVGHSYGATSGVPTAMTIATFGRVKLWW